MRNLNPQQALMLLSPLAAIATSCNSTEELKQPNIVFVFADQLRSQSLGYTGDINIKTPNIDKLAGESINFSNTYACTPMSTPYRASLMTGQYTLTHGLFLNDLHLDSDSQSIGKSYKNAGYNTAYVGKWHINGNGRSNYIAPEDRQGFDYFKSLECTHNYNNSFYYDNNDTSKRLWDGYDAFAQTNDVIDYMNQHAGDEEPFMLMLSIGTPHSPYNSAPQKYKDMFKDMDIQFRDNVPEEMRTENNIEKIKGYYAHIAALDDCIEALQSAIKELGIEDNTIFVLTSDHGDMLSSHGYYAKQQPYDESISVPFLLKYPAMFGSEGRETDLLFNSYDIMPTLLAMSNLPIPESVDGRDMLPILLGEEPDDIIATSIECVSPCGQWSREIGGREYRGIRTKRYTYVESLDGAWMLFDNETDPFQLNNLVGQEEFASLQAEMAEILKKQLADRGDEFLGGWDYIDQWGYRPLVSENGTTLY